MGNKRKKLPIGIQTFRDMREDGYYYVDKTEFAVRLADAGKYYFLSRPRRFGKSLFLDTLKDLFEARRKLFDGLYAADHWDWSVAHPVIRVSFGTGDFSSREALEVRIGELLRENAERLGVDLTQDSSGGRMGELIRKANALHGQRVVVLIDEYDKPILDNIEKPEAAIAARECLRAFYSALKDADPYLRFVFLTGVSKLDRKSVV